MTPEEFMTLSMEEKLETVNSVLQNEQKDHLKNVSEKVGIPYNFFTKLMRDNGNYHYSQSNKRYEKLLSLEEYEAYLQSQPQTNHASSQALQFIEEHLDELKALLHAQENQLILDPKVYDQSCETSNKSLQLNMDIFKEFSKFISTHYPHYRQRDLLSQSLLDFIRRYQKAPTE